MADAPQKTTSGAGTAKQTKSNPSSSANPTTQAVPPEILARERVAGAAAQQPQTQAPAPEEVKAKQTSTRRPVPKKAPPARKAPPQQAAPQRPARSEAPPAPQQAASKQSVASEAPLAAISPEAQEEGQVQLQAFIEANEAIMTSMATLSSEMVTFGTKRLAENIERNHTLLGCEEPEQVMRVQSEFIGQATKQYLDQVNTVINLVNEMTRAMWGPYGVTPQESASKEKPSDD